MPRRSRSLDSVRSRSTVSCSSETSSLSDESSRRHRRRRRRKLRRREKQADEREAKRHRLAEEADAAASAAAEAERTRRRVTLIEDAIARGDSVWLSRFVGDGSGDTALRFRNGCTMLHLVVKACTVSGVTAMETAHALLRALPLSFADMLSVRDTVMHRTPLEAAHEARCFLLAFTFLSAAHLHAKRRSDAFLRRHGGNPGAYVFADVSSSPSSDDAVAADGGGGKGAGGGGGDAFAPRSPHGYTPSQYEAAFRSRILQESLAWETQRREKAEARARRAAAAAAASASAPAAAEAAAAVSEPALPQDVAAQDAARYDAFVKTAPAPAATVTRLDELPWPTLRPDGELPVPAAAAQSVAYRRHHARLLLSRWHPDKIAQNFAPRISDDTLLSAAVAKATSLAQKASSLLTSSAPHDR